jgi:hypothetical protein
MLWSISRRSEMTDFTCRFLMEAGYMGSAFTISRLNLDAAIDDAIEQLNVDNRRRGFELSQDGERKLQFMRRATNAAF